MKQIVAVRGASNAVVQDVMMDFVRRSSRRGLRIVGVVEGANDREHRPCAARVLRDVVTGATYPIYQNLGPGSTACRLDSAGVVEACEAVRVQILEGCDLVVLSKFGKLEAARGGLTAAFAAAAETETPILTAVSPVFCAQWAAFSAPLADFIAPDPVSLDRWWQGIGGALKQGRAMECDGKVIRRPRAPFLRSGLPVPL